MILHYKYIFLSDKFWNILNCENSNPLTHLKRKPGEDRAPGPARQPQDQGVRARAPLRLHEVVDQLRPGLLLYLHVPAASVGHRLTDAHQRSSA